MDRIETYRDCIERVLREYASYQYAHGDIDRIPVFDRDGDHYLLVIAGWDDRRRTHGTLIHMDIVDGKIWIQRDGTEDGMAAELERLGISKEEIVLAFHHPDLRPHTDYAAA